MITREEIRTKRQLKGFCCCKKCLDDDVKQAEFREALLQNRTDILKVFAVPPAILGKTKKVTKQERINASKRFREYIVDKIKQLSK